MNVQPADAASPDTLPSRRDVSSGRAARSLPARIGDHAHGSTLADASARVCPPPAGGRNALRRRPRPSPGAPRACPRSLRARVRRSALRREERLVAFSCKTRGFCPSCTSRRMAGTAAHLVDRVLPARPVPPVGAVVAAAGPVPARPRHRPPHAGPRRVPAQGVRLATSPRARPRQGRSTMWRRHVHPAVRLAAQPQLPRSRPAPRRCVRGRPGRRRRVSSAAPAVGRRRRPPARADRPCDPPRRSAPPRARRRRRSAGSARLRTSRGRGQPPRCGPRRGAQARPPVRVPRWLLAPRRSAHRCRGSRGPRAAVPIRRPLAGRQLPAVARSGGTGRDEPQASVARRSHRTRVHACRVSPSARDPDSTAAMLISRAFTACSHPTTRSAPECCVVRRRRRLRSVHRECEAMRSSLDRNKSRESATLVNGADYIGASPSREAEIPPGP